MSEWKDRWDEIESAPEIYITERPRWCMVHTSYKAYEAREWAPRSMDGLWFDAVKWRMFRQTRLTSTPLLKLEDVKPFVIDGSVGKFKFVM